MADKRYRGMMMPPEQQGNQVPPLMGRPSSGQLRGMMSTDPGTQGLWQLFPHTMAPKQNGTASDEEQEMMWMRQSQPRKRGMMEPNPELLEEFDLRALGGDILTVLIGLAVLALFIAWVYLKTHPSAL